MLCFRTLAELNVLFYACILSVIPQEQSDFYHNHLEDRWTQIYRIQIIVLILATCYQK